MFKDFIVITNCPVVLCDNTPMVTNLTKIKINYLIPIDSHGLFINYIYGIYDNIPSKILHGTLYNLR